MIREKTFTTATAIALRSQAYSETSSIVTWLSPEYGKISTIVKGSFRPKSEFLGQYDLFYTCELVYYDKDRNGLHLAKEFTPLKTRSGIREKWRSAVMASYISCLTSETPHNDPHSRDIYTLTEKTLDFLDQYQAGIPVLLWFELRYLITLGLAPHIDGCSKCGAALTPGKPAEFSIPEGGLHCSKCAAGTSSRSCIRIQPGSIAALKLWQKSSSPRLAGNTRFSADQITELSNLLKSFLEFHIDFQHESRNITLKLLRNNSKRKT